MSDLHSFVRDTEFSVEQPRFEVMIATRRGARRRRAAVTIVAAVAAVLASALAVAGLGQLGHRDVPSGSAPQLLVPDWTADEIVGHADAFVVNQVASRSDSSTTLTVWKRCTQPRADHDCFGREALAVVDGADNRSLTLGAVTGSRQQPSLGDDGLLREVGEGLWYWAHVNPGPYLVSATMSQPVQVTVMPGPVAHSFGVPSIECPDQLGLCILDEHARTLGRLAIPDVPDTRWATPTPEGCGLWGLAGLSGNLRLIIQQRDGSFASADIADDSPAAAMAEGGPNCEIAYYQAIVGNRYQLVVSLDQGKTWQIRRTSMPQMAGYAEKQPRLRTLIPPRWALLPPMPDPLPAPRGLQPL